MFVPAGTVNLSAVPFEGFGLISSVGPRTGQPIHRLTDLSAIPATCHSVKWA